MTPTGRVPSERRRAAVAGHLDDEAAARHALNSDDANVRATALGALARMGRLSTDDVGAAIADADAIVRRRACELVIPLHDIDLTPLLRDYDAMVVESCAFALGERGSAAGRDAVVALSTVATTHDEPLCREAAVAALGSIGDAEGLPAILAGTTDKPAVRRRAVLALAPFEGADVDAALQRALEDRDWQVRQAAEDLLSDYSP
jgi:HEAT repeat protein